MHSSKLYRNTQQLYIITVTDTGYSPKTNFNAEREL